MPYDRRPSDSGRPQRSGRPGPADSRGRPGGARSAGGASRGRSNAEPGRPTGPSVRRSGPRPATPTRPWRDGESNDRSPRTGSAGPRGPRREGGPSSGARTESRPYDNEGRRSAPPRRDSPRRDPRAAPVTDGERPRRYDSSRPRPQSGGQSAGRAGGRDRVPPRRVETPKTAAQIRSLEVKAARGLREPRQQAAPPPWEREQWVDDGPLRSVARKATARAQRPEPDRPVEARALDSTSKPARRRKSSDLAPEVAEDLQKSAPAARAAKYRERLTTAADALDRGRFDDARRMVQPVLRDLPEMAFGHEIAGLAFYRTGQWRKAAAELEVARGLDRTLNHHAVLADCYRALKRYDLVEELWLEIREGSPEPALMAEGRIVAAGALADQGNLKGALKLMERGADVPKKVRDHHLRQWYVLGDLHDRSGDIIKARRFFGMISEVDPQFADVADRLRGLGR
jgi:hypothetical protein